MTLAVWAPLTAFAASLLAVSWLARSRMSGVALDHPNERSLHAAPVPRTGGIGLLAAVALASPIVSANVPLAVWVGLAVVFAISPLDDLRGMPAAIRLVTHLAAAGIVAAILLRDDFGAPGVIAAALAITWMANLYNFMDGSDGLAGGMTLIGFSFFGIAAWLAGSTAFALLSFTVAAAAAGFLVFNFHPARIFMGDAGSVPLGFLAAVFGVIGWLQRDWAWWFPALVFAPFVVDASITLARRLAAGQRVWEAHRDHYYQRLVQLGWGHRRTALAEYGMMLASGLAGLTALGMPADGQAAVVILAVAIHLALAAAIGRAWHRAAARNRA